MRDPLKVTSRSGKAQEKKDRPVKTVALQAATAKGYSEIVFLQTANVLATGENEKAPTQVFFDGGSQSSFITEELSGIRLPLPRKREINRCFRRS